MTRVAADATSAPALCHEGARSLKAAFVWRSPPGEQTAVGITAPRLRCVRIGGSCDGSPCSAWGAGLARYALGCSPLGACARRSPLRCMAAKSGRCCSCCI
eukprot:scaffold4879_cov354-Prasinococcus_capsulatus_cf.AAC.2